METKDIVGKTIKCFEFKNMPSIIFDSEYRSHIGKTGTVLNIHDSKPEYTNVKVEYSKGKFKERHYPTDLILKQLNELEEEENKPVDLEELIRSIRRITP